MAKVLDSCKSFLLIVHKCPDPDAAGAAVALASALKARKKKVSIGVDKNTISKQTKLLLKKLHHKISFKPDYDVDCIVVLDTNSPMLFSLDKVLNSKAKKVLIDHHHPKQEVVECFDEAFIDEEAVSATQIIYYLLSEMNVSFTRNICLAIAAGILTDSANFVAATVESFLVLGEVLEKGNLSFQEVLESVSVPMEMSEKIARLKASQRLKFYRNGKHLIAVSKVSSFEGGVAKALLYLGADVSFVGAARGNDVRISARAANTVVSKGFHLGKDVMPLISDVIGGDAGGHAGAAGANGTKPENLDRALRLCVERTRELLRAI
ncbi:MAG: DHH family phosphoesterase [Candidatus Diapherotrites archaeon]|nr:DHH family phosphoesterase [Candidatus Diapherotrites archaeon]